MKRVATYPKIYATIEKIVRQPTGYDRWFFPPGTQFPIYTFRLDDGEEIQTVNPELRGRVPRRARSGYVGQRVKLFILPTRTNRWAYKFLGT